MPMRALSAPHRRFNRADRSRLFKEVRSLAMLFLAAAVAAVTLLGTSAKAEEAAHPIETCNGRVTAFVGTGESIKKGVRMLHVGDGEDCSFFVTERVSANGKRILRTCPIGSSCPTRWRRRRQRKPSKRGTHEQDGQKKHEGNCGHHRLLRRYESWGVGRWL